MITTTPIIVMPQQTKENTKIRVSRQDNKPIKGVHFSSICESYTSKGMRVVSMHSVPNNGITIVFSSSKNC